MSNLRMRPSKEVIVPVVLLLIGRILAPGPWLHLGDPSVLPGSPPPPPPPVAVRGRSGCGCHGRGGGETRAGLLRAHGLRTKVEGPLGAPSGAAGTAGKAGWPRTHSAMRRRVLRSRNTRSCRGCALAFLTASRPGCSSWSDYTTSRHRKCWGWTRAALSRGSTRPAAPAPRPGLHQCAGGVSATAITCHLCGPRTHRPCVSTAPLHLPGSRDDSAAPGPAPFPSPAAEVAWPERPRGLRGERLKTRHGGADWKGMPSPGLRIQPISGRPVDLRRDDLATWIGY